MAIPSKQNLEDDFVRDAEQPRLGFFQEFWAFLCYNKKWWMTPIIVVLLLLAGLLVLSGTAAAPFIYTLW